MADMTKLQSGMILNILKIFGVKPEDVQALVQNGNDAANAVKTGGQALDNMDKRLASVEASLVRIETLLKSGEHHGHERHGSDFGRRRQQG